MENGNEDTALEKKLGTILDKEAYDEEETTGKDLMESKEFLKYLFGAVLVIALLGIWVYTTVYFCIETLTLDCNVSLDDHTDEEATAAYVEMMGRCEEAFGQYATFIHNIAFGLVTTVVVQQLGNGSDGATSLYNRFLPIYQRQVKKANEMRYEHGVVSWNILNLAYNYMNQVFMWVILLSTRVYVLSWIVLGAFSLIFGFVNNAAPSKKSTFTFHCLFF